MNLKKKILELYYATIIKEKKIKIFHQLINCFIARNISLTIYYLKFLYGILHKV